MEDVTEIILNLKPVRFKRQIDDMEEENVTLTIGGQEQLKAADIKNLLLDSKC